MPRHAASLYAWEHGADALAHTGGCDGPGLGGARSKEIHAGLDTFWLQSEPTQHAPCELEESHCQMVHEGSHAHEDAQAAGVAPLAAFKP